MIEENAETVLEEIGIDFRDDPEALAILKDKGCDIKGERVHFRAGWPVLCVKQRRHPSPSMPETQLEMLKLVERTPYLRLSMVRLLFAI